MPSSDIYVRIGAKLDGLQRGIRKSERQLKRFADFAERTGSTLTTRLSAPLALVGAAAVKTFASFEKTKLGLTALYKEADIAEQVFSDLLNVVKDTKTTLDFKTATTAALQLKAVGIEGERATQVIKQLAIAATLSGSSSDDVGEVARQLTQAASKGRILQQELRIILERIPALAGVIKDEFGVVTADALRDAGVSAEEFINRLTKAVGQNQRFQSVQGGLSKAFETFRIELQIAGAQFGETIAKSINLQENLGRLSNFISRAVDKFSSLSDGTKKTIVIFTGALTAIGPLILGLGAMAKVLLAVRASTLLVGGALKTLFLNPVGLAIAAVAALVIGLVKLYNASAKFRAIIAGVGSVVKNFIDNAIDSLKAFADIFGAVIRGDFKGAGRALRDFFEKDGETAGEAYANAFQRSMGNSLSQQAARNFGTRGRLGGSVERVAASAASSVDLEALFPDEVGGALPTLGGGASTQSPVTRDAVQLVDTLNRIPEEKLRLANTVLVDMKRSAEDLGLAFVPVNEELSATTENLLSKLEPIRAGFVSIAEEIASLATSGALSFKNFADAAVKSIGEIVRALVQQAVAGIIASNAQFAAFLGPAAGFVAAAAGKTAAGLFTSLLKNIPGLAQGGIIPPGFPNDTFPAMLSSGEAVIPLDRINDMISGGGGSSTIRGEDIYLAYNRYANSIGVVV